MPASLRALALLTLFASSTNCASSRALKCDLSSRADCDYGSAPVFPLRGFTLVPPQLQPDEPEPWGGKWKRGAEEVWIAKSRPDYPVFYGLGPKVEAARACQGLVPAVHKSLLLPPMDAPVAIDVLFFTREGRAYQVGYARPVHAEPSRDVLEFMSRFCGSE